jgi:hypothetical protein
MVEPSVCAEKHRRVDERLDGHDIQLKDHDKRIGDLEKYQSRAEEQVSQLCKQIKSLVKAMWWAMGLAVSTLLGFFVWYVQNIGKP